MRAAWLKLLARLGQLRRSEGGTAAVEFALILPIMLMIYIGSIEASSLISMDRRVQSVTGALGDLVARSNATITASSLNDYFRAASGIMTPYPSTDLRQQVTLVKVNTDNTAVVVWSKQFSNNVMINSVNRAAPNAYPLPQAMKDIAKGSYVIVSEAAYSYLPMYGIIIKQPVSLYRENFFMPRFGGTIAFTN